METAISFGTRVEVSQRPKLTGSAIRLLSLAAVLTLWSSEPSLASAIYQVSVNTSAIAGVTGNIDLQLANGGGTFQAATAAISLFSSVGGTLLGAPVTNGDVTGGPLPATVVIGNSTGFNDYFQGFLFGSSVQFRLTLDGPAITSPNGTSTSGSTFGLALYDAAGTTPLLTSDPNGFIGLANINLNGSVTITTLNTATGGPPVATFSLVNNVPEPSTLSLLAIAFLVLCSMRCFHHRPV